MDTNNKNAKEDYIKGFIRQYVIARNTLSPNTLISKNNWGRVIQPWSSAKVFSELKSTILYNEYALKEQTPNISCSVNFSNSNRDRAIIKINNNTYNVNFIWICENIGGQTLSENYKIQIRIQSDLDEKISGVSDYLDKISANPLGIQVVQYTDIDGKGDPLNSDITSRLKF